MSLLKYKSKRNFKESPEPKGGKPLDDKFRFVVQKHDASHLHYDFRLEMDGVLKSWAVPKGPSMDPEVKRLAMMVEDHPYDYRNFEGIIPSGYGAGTVIVWDEGYYELVAEKTFDKLKHKEPSSGSGPATKKTITKKLLAGLKNGKLHINIKGKKLKGEFGLVKAFGRAENGWLLFKVKDDYVSKDDILLKDKSVISKKTLEQVEKATSNFYGVETVKGSSAKKGKKNPNQSRPKVSQNAVTLRDKKKEKATRPGVTKKKASKKGQPAIAIGALQDSEAIETILAKTGKSPFLNKITPMLATLIDKPFDEKDWLYEVKWDGYRAMAFMNKGVVSLKSRNDKSFNEKFYPVHKALEELNINAIVDGEVVVLNENGISNFGALQNWRSEADGELLFYVFDILWFDGHDLKTLTLSDRREVLRSVIPATAIIRISETYDGSGIEFFEAAKKLGLEGIIAKKVDSEYLPGLRSTDWLKIKSNKRQEVVIGGFTLNDGTSKPFSSLLVGVFKGRDLIYTGKIGTGFSIQTQQQMMKQFKPLITKKTPFKVLPDINKPSRFRPDPPNATAVFLKPELVCEVSFTEMTSDGVMRHPSFEGMRTDKPAKKVILEKETPVEKITHTSKKSKTRPKQIEKKSNSLLKKIIMPTGKNNEAARGKTEQSTIRGKSSLHSAERKTFLNPGDETQVRKINGHELKFTNLSKIFWPDVNITKRDMLNYYYQMAPYILPYLKDRPQSMNRHPNGIKGESFYYKDVTGKAPDWIETYLYHSEADGRDRHYLVAKDEASLLYMASLGCIEMNPWHSKINKPDYPDWCVIDLDPGKTTFEQVIKAAQVTKKILDELDVPSYPKTSGSKGIHIYIPLGAKYTYEQSKEFARAIVTAVHEQLPEFTSIIRTVKARKGKMYLDFLQNRAQATISAPYSLRPKPGATVSMPLHWEEVKKGLKLSDFTIFNALKRIKSMGDLFKPVLGKGIDMNKAIKKFIK